MLDMQQDRRRITTITRAGLFEARNPPFLLLLIIGVQLISDRLPASEDTDHSSSSVHILLINNFRGEGGCRFWLDYANPPSILAAEIDSNSSIPARSESGGNFLRLNHQR